MSDSIINDIFGDCDKYRLSKFIDNFHDDVCVYLGVAGLRWAASEWCCADQWEASSDPIGTADGGMPSPSTVTHTWSIFYLLFHSGHMRTVSANERRRYISNVFSHWLRLFTCDLRWIDRKQTLWSATHTHLWITYLDYYTAVIPIA